MPLILMDFRIINLLKNQRYKHNKLLNNNKLIKELFEFIQDFQNQMILMQYIKKKEDFIFNNKVGFHASPL